MTRVIDWGRGSGAFALVVASALGVHCGKTEARPESAAGAAAAAGVSSSAEGSSSGSDTGGTGGSALAEEAGEGGEGGEAGADQGTIAAAGACAAFPHRNHQSGCEPKLRAMISSADERLRTFEYDASGRLVTVGDERPHDEFFAHRYRYDDEGRLTKAETYCDDDGLCERVYEYWLYESGALERAEERWTRADSESVHVVVYDELGRTLEDSSRSPGHETVQRFGYRSDGQVEWKTELEVDADGNEEFTTDEYIYGDGDVLLSVDTKDEDGITVAYRTFTYDERGLLLREDAYESDGEPIGHTTYTYDAAGLLEAVDSWDQLLDEGSSSRYEDGRLVETYRSEPYWTVRTFYDRLEQPALSITSDDGIHWLTGFVHGDAAFTTDVDDPGVSLGERHSAHWSDPSSLQPFAFSSSEVVDFSYVGEVHDYPGTYELTRRYFFDDEDRIERVEFDYWSDYRPLEIEILRCEGVTAEITRYPEVTLPDDSVAYYYGCDDFVLPTIP